MWLRGFHRIQEKRIPSRRRCGSLGQDIPVLETSLVRLRRLDTEILRPRVSGIKPISLAGKPAPPRPRSSAALTSLITPAGDIRSSAARAAACHPANRPKESAPRASRTRRSAVFRPGFTRLSPEDLVAHPRPASEQRSVDHQAGALSQAPRIRLPPGEAPSRSSPPADAERDRGDPDPPSALDRAGQIRADLDQMAAGWSAGNMK
jgi:hypothetical protein